MFEWFKRLFSPSPAAKTEIDLSVEGYSPAYADKRVREVRGKLIDMREHGRVIKESGHDKDGSMEASLGKACAKIELVLQNLKKDPNDFSRMGLALESLDPLIELLEKTAKFAATGNTGPKLEKFLGNAKQALDMTAEKFDQLLRGALQLDDEIELRGLKKTLEELNKK